MIKYLLYKNVVKLYRVGFANLFNCATVMCFYINHRSKLSQCAPPFLNPGSTPAIGKFKLRRSLKQAIFSTLAVGDMVYSTYRKQRILYHRFKGLKAPTTTKILVEEEGLGVTSATVRLALLADGQAMGGHLLSQMSWRLWRLKCRQVLNLILRCHAMKLTKGIWS